MKYIYLGESLLWFRLASWVGVYQAQMRGIEVFVRAFCNDRGDQLNKYEYTKLLIYNHSKGEH